MVADVPETVSPGQNGHAALRPSSSTFMALNVASVKPPSVYRPRSPAGSDAGRYLAMPRSGVRGPTASGTRIVSSEPQNYSEGPACVRSEHKFDKVQTWYLAASRVRTRRAWTDDCDATESRPTLGSSVRPDVDPDWC